MVNGPLIIFCAIIELTLTVYLIHALYRRIQAGPLEFMLTLVVSTMPITLALKYRIANLDPNSNFYRIDVLRGLVLGCLASISIFGCSIWAMSVARRMNLVRIWPRMILLLIGWSLTPAAAALLLAGLYAGYLVNISYHHVNVLLWVLHIMAYVDMDWLRVTGLFVAGSLPFSLAIWMDWKSRRKACLTSDAIHLH